MQGVDEAYDAAVADIARVEQGLKDFLQVGGAPVHYVRRTSPHLRRTHSATRLSASPPHMSLLCNGNHRMETKHAVGTGILSHPTTSQRPPFFPPHASCRRRQSVRWGRASRSSL